MKWKSFLLPVGILVVGFIGMRFFLSMRQEPARRAAQPRVRLVETAVVKRSAVNSQIIAFGRLASAQPVILASEVSGILKSGSIPFQPAQEFRKGDLLVKVDDRQSRYDLNSAKSELLTALAQVLPEIKVDFPDEYQVWQDYFNRFSFEGPLEPLPETANPKIKLFLARFNVYRLFFGAQNLQVRWQKHFFYAPFSGSIVSANLRVGSTANVGARLGSIINLENVEVEVPVTTADVPWIDRKKPVVFTSQELPGHWTGKIKRIGKAIDPQTQTIPVFISVEQSRDDNLFEGVFLRAEISGRSVQAAVEVPNRAVYNERFVYLIRKGRLEFREIEIARRQTESLIVSGGLASGDTLVTEVLQGVAPGMPARSRGAASAGRSD